MPHLKVLSESEWDKQFAARYTPQGRRLSLKWSWALDPNLVDWLTGPSYFYEGNDVVRTWLCLTGEHLFTIYVSEIAPKHWVEVFLESTEAAQAVVAAELTPSFGRPPDFVDPS